MTNADVRGSCLLMIEELKTTGHSLWIQGYLFGPDRVAGLSPADFGDDGVVGFAIVCQIGGELAQGVVTLLEADNRYGAAALLRQLVEVEYLTWWFETNAPEAATWQRSTPQELESLFRPTRLRQASAGVLPASEYRAHCELGGHPHPKSALLLLCHEPGVPASFLLDDLHNHLKRIVDRTRKLASQLDLVSEPAG